MDFLEENIRIREKNYLYMEQFYKKNDDFILLKHDHIQLLSTFAFPMVCKTPELRQKYIKKFTEAGIEIRPMIAGNMQRQPFYAKYVSKFYYLPGADLINTNGFYCGNYPELTDSDLSVIANCLVK